MFLRSRATTNSNNSNIINRNDKRTNKNECSDDEPKAKRKPFTDLNQGLRNVQLDSSKKKPEVKRKSENRDALPQLQESVITEEAEVDPAPEVDFDAETANDQFAVAPFAFDIFKYYRSREKCFKVDNYMPRQTDITKENRASLVNWMVELQETFELNHETLYLSVKLVDLFLSQEIVLMDEMQLIACAAMFIASKFDERSPPLIDDFIYMAEDSFDRSELIRMEMRVLKVVGYDLGSPLSYRYVRRYSRVAKQDMQTLTLARFILETSLAFYEFSGVSESRIAAAAFLLAMKMKDTAATWTPVLHKYSGLRESEIEDLMWELNHMLHIRKHGIYAKLRTVFEKYSHEVFYEVAKVPLLADKFPSDQPLSLLTN